MSRIKVIKKNDEYSLEYEIGDIFEVTGTWYGGVHINGRSGIPVSLDREEYRELEDGAKEQENEDESRRPNRRPGRARLFRRKPLKKFGGFGTNGTGDSFITPRTWQSPFLWKRRNCWRYFNGAPGMCTAGRKTDKIREELADVLLYCMLMADACGLDPDAIMQEKLKRNEEKYPVELAKGSREKYDQLKG